MQQITCNSLYVSNLRLCGELPTHTIRRVRPYGHVIRDARDRRQLSQAELAASVGASRDTIIRAEQSGNVGVLLLYRIADVLEIDITAFFGGALPARSDDDEQEVLGMYRRLTAEQRSHIRRSLRRLLGL